MLQEKEQGKNPQNIMKEEIGTAPEKKKKNEIYLLKIIK